MRCPACGGENVDGSETCFQCGRGLLALTRGAVLASRYEILETLGHGGMGMVYKAHDRVLDEVVAVKVLRHEFAGSEELTRRLRSEIKLARRVRHPNVCGLHEYGQEGSLSFVVMELVRGVDLRQLLRRDGPLPPDEAFDVGIQLAEGLQAIHDAGVVHRDLKTPNIMRDERGAVRLMDFGIAKQVGSDLATATATGQVLGTPEYMSPEQARGERVDARTDIYALGIVIFELFTGRVPFAGDTPLATIFKHLQEAPPLDDDVARLPPSLKPVLRRALGKTPDERFATAAEMEAALRAARADSATRPSEDSEPPPLLPTIALSATPAPGAAATPSTPVGPRPTPAPSSSPRSPALRRSLFGVAALGAGLLVGLALTGRQADPTDAGPQPSAVPADEPSPRAAVGASGWDASSPAPPARAEPSPTATASATPAATPAPSRPRAAPRMAERRAAPPPAVAAPGRLQLLILPWAEVEIDRRRIGTTPMRPVELAPGSYRVVLRHPSYKPLQKRVTIRPGETTRLEVDLGFEAFPR